MTSGERKVIFFTIWLLKIPHTTMSFHISIPIEAKLTEYSKLKFINSLIIRELDMYWVGLWWESWEDMGVKSEYITQMHYILVYNFLIINKWKFKSIGLSAWDFLVYCEWISYSQLKTEQQRSDFQV